MIRSCCCRPLFRCGFPIPFDVISDFRSCFVDDKLRVFFIHIVLSRKIKQEAERFLFKNLISSRRSLTFHRFAFSRIGLSSFDFCSLLFRFLICKRYNLLSIAIWSISTSINWTRLIERCKFNIRKFMREQCELIYLIIDHINSLQNARKLTRAYIYLYASLIRLFFIWIRNFIF